MYRHISGVTGRYIKEYKVTGDGFYMQIYTPNGIFYAPVNEFTYIGG